MNNRITHTDLAAELSQAKGLTKKDGERFMDMFFGLIEEYVIRDKVVKIKGLGTFKLVDVNDRESVNVNTGERIVIAGHSKLTFSPDTTLRDQVNSPFAEFETTVLNDNVDMAEMERMDTDTPQAAPVVVEEPAPVVVEEPVPVVQEDPVPTAQEEPAPTVHEEKEPQVPVSTTSSESLAAAKAAAAAAEAAAKAAAAVAEAAAKATPQNVQSQDVQPIVAEPKKKGTLHAWIWAVVTVVLIVASYVAGYRQLIPMPERSAKPVPTAPKTKPAPAPKHKPAPAQKPAPAPKKEPSPEELAKQYAQVEGGEYLIVGELDHVHHMKVGETLYKIAGKELGSQKLMPYIMVFNNYPDDVVIHPDEVIRLPKLVKKTE